jgi:hypothetical protein
MSKLYGFFWLVWLALFGVIEGTAAFNSYKGDTLSEWVWHLMDVDFFAFMLAAFFAWLILHFYTKGKVK